MHPTAPMLVPRANPDRNGNASNALTTSATTATIGQGGANHPTTAITGIGGGGGTVGVASGGMIDSPLLNMIMARRRSIGALSSSAPLSPSFFPQSIVAPSSSSSSASSDLAADASGAAPKIASTSIMPSFSPRMPPLVGSGSPVISAYASPWAALQRRPSLPNANAPPLSLGSPALSARQLLSSSSVGAPLPVSRALSADATTASPAFGGVSTSGSPLPVPEKQHPTVSPLLVELCENEWDFS